MYSAVSSGYAYGLPVPLPTHAGKAHGRPYSLMSGLRFFASVISHLHIMMCCVSHSSVDAPLVAALVVQVVRRVHVAGLGAIRGLCIAANLNLHTWSCACHT